MLCLRRTALRVLSSTPSVSLSRPAGKPRSITSLSYPVSIGKSQTTLVLSFQRRHYADEAASQSEPEADGATEAQHDEISRSATEEATEQASSAAESVKSAAQTASQTVTGAAQDLSAAAGFGSQASDTISDPPVEGEASTIVYVGNLFFDVKDEDLQNEFAKAGPVVNAKVVVDRRGLSKGFGYVTFETIEAAQRAIELYNLQQYEGRRISVQYSNGGTGGSDRPQRQNQLNTRNRTMNPPTKTLFIGNMSFDMSDRDLNTLFREIKNVTDVRVAIDRRTGQPRGFAHADFTDIESAEAAMKELAGKVVSGRALRLDFSTSTGRATTGAA